MKVQKARKIAQEVNKKAIEELNMELSIGLEEIFKGIKESAKNGNYLYRYNYLIPSEICFILKDLGYRLLEETKIGNTTLISWDF